MAKRLSAEIWEQRINEAGAGRYEFVRWAVDGEFGQLKKCVVRCVIDGFEWATTVHSLVFSSRGCPQCSGHRVWTDKERISHINEIKNIEFVCWVSEYKNKKSKAITRCEVDGFEWASTVDSLVNARNGCPQCSGKRRWTSEERIEQINKLENIEFVSWVGKYENSKSKANIRCKIDSFEWESSINDILSKGNGCPKCSGKIRWTAKERIEQINSLENIEFVRWDDGYKGKDSRANVICSKDGFMWSATAHSLVNSGHGCPKCAKSGYDPSKEGFLYALRSECGRYLKVGISNKPSRRHNQLEKRTPFKFNLVEQVSGDGAKIAELEKYFHEKYERAGFTGFDGCTEWLVCTPELLEELRNLGDQL